MYDENIILDILKETFYYLFYFIRQIWNTSPWLIIFLAILMIIPIVLNIIDLIRLKQSGMEEVDQMSGDRFEEYLKVLFKKKGYHVHLTPKSGDFGADLILSTKSQKIVVQAKRYKRNVGVKAIQEVVSAKNYYSASEAWVVTNSNFTEPAKKLAKANQVRLIDRELLMNWMLRTKKAS